MPNLYVYVFFMFAVTYAVRILPLTLIRKPIESKFIKSFLYYVPYVTLSVMTFPAILSATGSPWSGAAGFLTAIALSWRGKGLIFTSLVSCAAVFLLEAAIV